MKHKNGKKKLSIYLKKSPENRKGCFVGDKSSRDVLMSKFIAEDKIIFKMRTDRKEENYWTIVDYAG